MDAIEKDTLTRPRSQDVRDQIVPVVVWLFCGAVLLWGALALLGYLLTHTWADTSFARWDGSVNRWFAARRTGNWNAVTHVVTFGAETMTVIGVGIVFFIGLRIGLGRWRESVFLAVVLIGEVTIFVCTTFVIDRHRPAVAHLDSAPPTSSFPSGHTAASVSLYGALAIIACLASRRRWLRTVAVLLAIVMPIAVAFARMYRGMHYPTDVMAGALLALAWLAITSSVLLRTRR
jgi:membrane-associated phospholipid phosphatase